MEWQSGGVGLPCFQHANAAGVHERMHSEAAVCGEWKGESVRGGGTRSIPACVRAPAAVHMSVMDGYSEMQKHLGDVALRADGGVPSGQCWSPVGCRRCLTVLGHLYKCLWMRR
eukprot:1162062-Pelagomonas_calceolata.AAC.9